MYGYGCEYCDGTVRQKTLKQEAFAHPRGFVILENAPIGVCNKCGRRYYAAAVLKRVEALATGKQPPSRTEQVPVAAYSS